MINFWADKAKLKKFAEERKAAGSIRWMGGRFPCDGAWFPSGRRIEPCYVCGKSAVTLLTDDGTWQSARHSNVNLLWLCDAHERLFYSLI